MLLRKHYSPSQERRSRGKGSLTRVNEQYATFALHFPSDVLNTVGYFRFNNSLVLFGRRDDGLIIVIGLDMIGSAQAMQLMQVLRTIYQSTVTSSRVGSGRKCLETINGIEIRRSTYENARISSCKNSAESARALMQFPSPTWSSASSPWIFQLIHSRDLTRVFSVYIIAVMFVVFRTPFPPYLGSIFCDCHDSLDTVS